MTSAVVPLTVVRLQQGTHSLYVGAMRGEDLVRMTRVDVWRKEDDHEVGYQRAPDRSRARKVADYLIRSSDRIFPMSVLLNYREGSLSDFAVDDQTDVLHLELPSETIMYTVDGQHRIEGIRIAIEEHDQEWVRDYRVPTVIVDGLSVVDEATQFRVINETAKKVRTDLARRILARAAREAGGQVDVIKMGRMWEVRATEVIECLLADPSSPWVGRVQRPNEKRTPLHTIKELSFSNSLKPIVDTFPYKQYPAERVARLLIDYWTAWQNLVPDAFERPREYVLLKTPGVFSLHTVAPYVFQLCQEQGIGTSEEQFRQILKDLDEFVTEEYWHNDNYEGAAAFGSMKGFGILADLIIDRLREKGYHLG